MVEKDIKPEQVKAARALLRMEEEELARRASVSVSTVRRLEAEGGAQYVSPDTVDAVHTSLEEAGVEFIYDGVRKRRAGADDKARIFDDVRALVADYKAAQAGAGNVILTDDDLYDDQGLPR
jgi:transcriptional regulator with XRE-family HTH domain